MATKRSVADVRAALEPYGIAVQEVPDDARTAESAAAALSTPVATIVKSLLFFAGAQPVLVLAAGDRQVSPERLGEVVGAEDVRMARASEVTAVTGYVIGGVPPLAHATPLPVVMDRTLLAHETVYAAAGAGRAIFPVSPSRLAEIVSARVADIAA